MRMKNKVLVGLGAAVLAVGIAATPASAATRTDYDCYPGGASGGSSHNPQPYDCGTVRTYYTSADGHAKSTGIINYYANEGIIDVRAQDQQDVGPADGNGPLLWVEFTNGKTGAISRQMIHVSGSGNAPIGYGRPLVQADTVRVRLCNGLNGSTPQNCEANWHGPFAQ